MSSTSINTDKSFDAEVDSSCWTGKAITSSTTTATTKLTSKSTINDNATWNANGTKHQENPQQQAIQDSIVTESERSESLQDDVISIDQPEGVSELVEVRHVPFSQKTIEINGDSIPQRTAVSAVATNNHIMEKAKGSINNRDNTKRKPGRPPKLSKKKPAPKHNNNRKISSLVTDVTESPLSSHSPLHYYSPSLCDNRPSNEISQSRSSSNGKKGSLVSDLFESPLGSHTASHNNSSTWNNGLKVLGQSISMVELASQQASLGSDFLKTPPARNIPLQYNNSSHLYDQTRNETGQLGFTDKHTSAVMDIFEPNQSNDSPFNCDTQPSHETQTWEDMKQNGATNDDFESTFSRLFESPQASYAPTNCDTPPQNYFQLSDHMNQIGLTKWHNKNPDNGVLTSLPDRKIAAHHNLSPNNTNEHCNNDYGYDNCERGANNHSDYGDYKKNDNDDNNVNDKKNENYDNNNVHDNNNDNDYNIQNVGQIKLSSKPRKRGRKRLNSLQSTPTSLSDDLITKNENLDRVPIKQRKESMVMDLSEPSSNNNRLPIDCDPASYGDPHMWSRVGEIITTKKRRLAKAKRYGRRKKAKQAESARRESDAESDDETFHNIAIERITIPHPKTKQSRIWKNFTSNLFRFRNTIVFQSCCKDAGVDVPEQLHKLHVLYTLLKVRLAAGMFRTAIKTCHNILKSAYREAEHILNSQKEDGPDYEIDIAALAYQRVRIAGLWCVYAHVVAELGEMCVRYKGWRSRKRSTETNCSTSATRGRPANEEVTNTTMSDIKDHTIAILLSARSCPLVGNFPWVVLGVSRLIVSMPILEVTDNNEHATYYQLDKLIKLAISACWDGIDLCSTKNTNHQPLRYNPEVSGGQKSMKFLSNFQFDHRNSIVEDCRIRPNEMENSFQEVLLLPKKLSRLCCSRHIFLDRKCTAELCRELNRLSQLGEKLQTNSIARLSPTVSHNGILDELPLFRAADVPTQYTTITTQNPDLFDRKRNVKTVGNSSIICQNVEYSCCSCFINFDSLQARNEHQEICTHDPSSGGILWKW